MKNRPDFHPARTKIVQLMGLEPYGRPGARREVGASITPHFCNK